LNLSVQVTAKAEPLLANVEKLKIYRFYCRSVEALAAPDRIVRKRGED